MRLEFSGSEYTREDLRRVASCLTSHTLEITYDIGVRQAEAMRPIQVTVESVEQTETVYVPVGDGTFRPSTRTIIVSQENVEVLPAVPPPVPLIETVRKSPTCELISGGIIVISGSEAFNWDAIREDIDRCLLPTE